jgi:hypothetical protein
MVTTQREVNKMKNVYKTCVVSTLTALLSASTLLAAPAAHNSKPAAKAAATFVCKHCNIKMTPKKKTDLQKTCWVCKCKKPASACMPTKK